MSAPYIHIFAARKTLSSGELASMADGSPSLGALIQASFPGRKFILRAADTVVWVTFTDEPEPSASTLDADYTAWDPERDGTPAKNAHSRTTSELADATPEEGAIAHDSDADVMKAYLSGAWRTFTTS